MYDRGLIPSRIDEILRFLDAEFRRIQDYLRNPRHDSVVLNIQTDVPKINVDIGTIMYFASGVHGEMSVEGLYVFRSDGWTLL